MTRVSAFVVVGVVGFVVQAGLLAWLTGPRLGVPVPLATLLAVEATVLHNFVWHERWTWADRRGAGSRVSRLLRFHAGAGLTSLVANVAITSGAVALFGWHVVVANAAAVVLTSAANFLLADRWVFVRTRGVAAAVLLVAGASVAHAEPSSRTIDAWARYVQKTEALVATAPPAVPAGEPVGRTVDVPEGTIHEWRGSLLVPGITVPALVHALTNPGLPPPSVDVLDARVLRHDGDELSVYLKVTRSALITVTYDTEHDVTFTRHGPGFATSRSVARRIVEADGGDRGFLWRLNSYWSYRQVGNAVRIDVLSLSLSRGVPAVLKPVAGPIITRIARESMRNTLDAMERFAGGLQARAATSTPAEARPARNHAASDGAPGVSPWTQMVSMSRASTAPSIVSTDPSVAMRMARVTTSSTLRIIAPGVLRGTSEPSARYARSANPSRATRRPASFADASMAEPGGAQTMSAGEKARVAATRASAIARSRTARL